MRHRYTRSPIEARFLRSTQDGNKKVLFYLFKFYSYFIANRSQMEPRSEALASLYAKENWKKEIEQEK